MAAPNPELCDVNNPAALRRAARAKSAFEASTLAGQDFCAEACDPTQQTDEDYKCIESGESGALLQRCHPSDVNPDDAAADCPAGLNCYRTNLIRKPRLVHRHAGLQRTTRTVGRTTTLVLRSWSVSLLEQRCLGHCV